jgi:hypothetical protein
MKKSIFFIFLLFTCLEMVSQITTSDTEKSNVQSKDTTFSKSIKVLDSDSIKNKEAINAINSRLRELAVLKKRGNKYLKENQKLLDRRNALQNDSVKLANLKNTLLDEIENAKKELDKIKNDVKGADDTFKQKKNEADSLTKSNNEIEKKLKEAQMEILKKEDSLEIIAKICIKNSAPLISMKGSLNKKEKGEIENYFQSLNKKDYNKMADNIEFQDDKGNVVAEAAKTVITHVRIEVNEGLINDLIVYTDKGIFRNKKATIDLVHVNEERLGDTLWMEGKDSKQYMLLGNVISYTPMKSYSDLPYTQFKIVLFPGTDKSCYELKESTSINAYFDVSVFTDIKGIGGEANGIAQINGNAKFIRRTKNVPNTAGIFFNFVSFVGGLAKFDNAFKGTFIDSVKNVKRTDLLQRATYFVGVKHNIFHAVRSPYPKRSYSDFQLNAGYNFTGSKIFSVYYKDTAARKGLDTVYRNVTQNHFYVEPMVTFSRNGNFSMTVALPISFVNVKKSADILNDASETWITPSVSMMYFSKRNSKNKLFFRYNHWINIKKPENAFLQLQLGYSASISDLLGGSK